LACRLRRVVVRLYELLSKALGGRLYTNPGFDRLTNPLSSSRYVNVTYVAVAEQIIHRARYIYTTLDANC
jgi:hypothetical protein